MATRTQTVSQTVPDPVARIFAALEAPIDPEKIKTRPGTNGRDLRFIQAPTVMERLDSAVGPANWRNDVTMGAEWVKCRITITLPDGREVYRDGIGGYPDMPTPEDRVKGAASDALKRAGLLFGIARDLYEDAGPTPGGGYPQRDRNAWGPPQGQRPSRPEPARSGAPQGGYGPPRSGRALFAWAKDHDRVEDVNRVGKRLGYGGRMVDWSPEMVGEVYEELTGEVAEEPAHAPRRPTPTPAGVGDVAEIDEDSTPF